MKERLDVLLVKHSLASSREKAKALVMAGQVYVNGQKEDKAGTFFEEPVSIEVRGKAIPFVSRGGLKLDKAMHVFPVTTDGKVCMDVGASTGGFTDCMLQSGARKVYSVDVGYGQLDWKLRNDDRVVCMEKTNIRYLTPDQLNEKVKFVSIDVSFISLSKVFPAVKELIDEGSDIVALIKPQFEAGRDKVGKKGVVRDPDIHIEVIMNVLQYAADSKLSCMGLDFSPVRGPEGNIEYLLWMRYDGDESKSENSISGEDIEKTVSLAHMELS